MEVQFKTLKRFCFFMFVLGWVAIVWLTSVVATIALTRGLSGYDIPFLACGAICSVLCIRLMDDLARWLKEREPSDEIPPSSAFKNPDAEAEKAKLAILGKIVD